MKKILKGIKYQRVTEIFNDLFLTIKPQIMNKISIYKRLVKDFVIQPVPLHSTRFRERGFNQAQIISNFLADNLECPIVDLLERKKPTPFLAQMTKKKDRRLTIKGAFVTKHHPLIHQKNLILVDDVITTTSTVGEATRVLKRNGVARVFVFALAKG